ncbi:DNA-formamidopyrimidine glycosylase family protein [Nocardioides sp.]|uniref:DNA-formamidopyrimidine glycosylase family protein n=1 Tax=Nocardioides sp. TaxID=35761 RepID=UPI002ECFFF91
MPEGDAVVRTARRLDRGLAGQVLTATDFRVPQHATADLSGGVVVGTHTRGKHLFTRVDRGDERWSLHTHLKMEGSWRVYDSGQRWTRPAFQARVVLTTAERSAVGFSLGVVELLPRAREEEPVAHLGPDVLGQDWDPAEAVRRLRQHPDLTIREALLDQRNLAGIGTMWVAETCFAVRVHPRTPVAVVPDLTALVTKAQELMAASAVRMRQRMWVYGRRRNPCPRCGGPVEVEQLGPPGRERPSYFCPRCQPAP